MALRLKMLRHFSRDWGCCAQRFVCARCSRPVHQNVDDVPGAYFLGSWQVGTRAKASNCHDMMSAIDLESWTFFKCNRLGLP